ncbi:helix-turn-helix domain-containing protein [Streptomyces sp. NPDC008222]|uniref:helix-turn-helix domain-containing protein n=1 Tax=Streptomyces sp. NPDC008222 TaxID=3364820 RepID=UPI0036E8B629
MLLGEHLRGLRERTGLVMRAFVSKYGNSQTTISRYERGDRLPRKAYLDCLLGEVARRGNPPLTPEDAQATYTLYRKALGPRGGRNALLRRGARLRAGGAGLAVRLMGDHLSAARSETRPDTPEEHRRHPVQAETPGHTGHPHRTRTRPVHSAPHLTTNPPRRPGPLTQPQDRSAHYVTYRTLRGDRTGSTLLPHCFLDPCPGPPYRPWAGYQDRKSNHTRTDQGFGPRCSALPPHHDRRRSNHSVDPEQDCP